MTARSWARVLQAGAHGLRRGAWYPVVNVTNRELVLLDVHKANVPVPRTLVELSDHSPDAWSVVQWDGTEPGADRAGELNRGLTYAVCPHCRARAPLGQEAERMVCPECTRDAEVDWAHPC